jgi:LPXTG-motif cell wall-anchored protein
VLFRSGAVIVVVAAAGTAHAGPIVDRAAEALRRDPVYVDEGARSAISGDEAERIRDRIRRGRQPVFVAVLPREAASEVGGDPGQVAAAVGEGSGLQGTYAVLVGDSFRAASTRLPRGEAGALATAAFQRSRDGGRGAVLLDFVDRVNEAGAASRGSQGGEDIAESSDGESGTSLGLVLGVLLVAGLVGGGGFMLWRRRKQAREVEAARQELRPELQMLADDVVALEPQVTLHPEAEADYDAAVNRYRAADAAMLQVRSIEQVGRLRRVLAEGNYAMARARARVDGREPPPPPPELASVGSQQEPAVVVDERGEPSYAGYGGGWYGGGWFGGGDLLTGILIGQALGGWGWGGGWGHHHDHGQDGGDSGDSGGDFGGGDFGGGDFGGGDFGGGDFGGGDF